MQLARVLFALGAAHLVAACRLRLKLGAGVRSRAAPRWAHAAAEAMAALLDTPHTAKALRDTAAAAHAWITCTHGKNNFENLMIENLRSAILDKDADVAAAWTHGALVSLVTSTSRSSRDAAEAVFTTVASYDSLFHTASDNDPPVLVLASLRHRASVRAATLVVQTLDTSQLTAAHRSVLARVTHGLVAQCVLRGDEQASAALGLWLAAGQAHAVSPELVAGLVHARTTGAMHVAPLPADEGVVLQLFTGADFRLKRAIAHVVAACTEDLLADACALCGDNEEFRSTMQAANPKSFLSIAHSQ